MKIDIPKKLKFPAQLSSPAKEVSNKSNKRIPWSKEEETA
jgi:hypothetical protein